MQPAKFNFRSSNPSVIFPSSPSLRHSPLRFSVSLFQIISWSLSPLVSKSLRHFSVSPSFPAPFLRFTFSDHLLVPKSLSLQVPSSFFRPSVYPSSIKLPHHLRHPLPIYRGGDNTPCIAGTLPAREQPFDLDVLQCII